MMLQKLIFLSVFPKVENLCLSPGQRFAKFCSTKQIFSRPSFFVYQNWSYTLKKIPDRSNICLSGPSVHHISERLTLLHLETKKVNQNMS